MDFKFNNKLARNEQVKLIHNHLENNFHLGNKKVTA